MSKRNNDACCSSTDSLMGCCKVESIISIDERGQMVLPKELRERADIRAGDKMAVTSWEKDGNICCICLIKAENLAEMVRDMLGPVMSGVKLQDKTE
jgi:antitoxin PrlF